MGDDPELARIERRLRRAREDLEAYQRRREVEEVHRLPRHQRKRWMLRRMRDLGLVTLILGFPRWVKGNPAQVTATSAAGALVGVLAFEPPAQQGDDPGRAATPPMVTAPPSPEYRAVQVEIHSSEPTSGPAPEPGEPAAEPASTVASEVTESAEAADAESVAAESPEPEPSLSAIPPEEEPSPSPAPSPTTSPEEPEQDLRELCLEFDAVPVADLGVCVRELLGLFADS